jgi:hypothetical protein
MPNRKFDYSGITSKVNTKGQKATNALPTAKTTTTNNLAS